MKIINKSVENKYILYQNHIFSKTEYEMYHA